MPIKLYAAVILLFFSLTRSHAQVARDTVRAARDTVWAPKETKAEKNLKFRLLPYVNYSRTLEFQYGLIGMAMYRLQKHDTISPKSISGAIGIHTTNGSWVASVFSRWFLYENNLRITTYFATGTQFSQFYLAEIPSPGFTDFHSDVSIFNIDLLYQLKKKWYGGLGFVYNEASTEFDDVPFTTFTRTYGLQLITMLDTRDEIYYPHNGSKTKLHWTVFPTWLGNEDGLSTLTLTYNKYISVAKDRDVMAFRSYGSFGFGTVNFERQAVVGGTDIRGYSEGKYRGDGVFAVQGEYRWNFAKSIGMVGFAGVATLYGSRTDDFNGKLYPGAGLGFRYTAFKEENFKIGLDAAIGKDDWGVYFRLGEAF